MLWVGHHNDIAHWSMDLDKSGPVSVQSSALWRMCEDKIYDTPVDYEVVSEYADGFHIVISNKMRMGVTWYGEDGQTLWVTRGKIECSTPEWLAEAYDRGPIKPYRSSSHTGNFIDCIRSGEPTICPAETGHRSITPGHLGWISHHLGGKRLEWDAASETITNLPEADARLKEVNYRGDWKLEAQGSGKL